MLLFKQCWAVNSSVLTFLEVGFWGNLVQGFRVYAWRAVPSFPQIALCFLTLALRPQPFEFFANCHCLRKLGGLFYVITNFGHVPVCHSQITPCGGGGELNTEIWEAETGCEIVLSKTRRDKLFNWAGSQCSQWGPKFGTRFQWGLRTKNSPLSPKKAPRSTRD